MQPHEHGYSYIHRQWSNRKQGLGPFFHIEQYGRYAYDHIGKMMSFICGAIFLTIFVGAFVATIVSASISLWNYTHRTEQASVYAPDPCSLSDVDCVGESD